MLRFIAAASFRCSSCCSRSACSSFLIFFATPGSTRRPDRGQERRPADAARSAQGLRARQAAARPVRADDEEALHHARPDVVREPRREGDPAGDAGRAGDALARLRRAVIWVLASIAMGMLAGVFRGTPIDTTVMVVGLIGISMPVFWLGEVVNLLTQSRFHDTCLFSWVPPLGYIPFSAVAVRLVQVAASSRGSRSRSSTSASTRACSAPRSSRRRRRTTSGLPARRD